MDELSKKRLAECNEIPICQVTDEVFASYGRIVTGYDFSGLISYMENQTTVPKKGNCYVPSVPGLEQDAVKEQVERRLYGELPIQIGYCNGRNSSYNGFEYHKCSEINIAVTDFLLVLGHTWEMEGNTFHTDQAKVFLVEKGTAVEMYQTTLHLSPCKVTDEGYKDIVILARGTNTDLACDAREAVADPEQEILLKKNKWIITHPEWEPLRAQGAYPGVRGENKVLCYPAE